MIYSLPSPIGHLNIHIHQGYVTALDLPQNQQTALNATMQIQEAAKQLQHYFSNAKHAFTLMIKPAGTAFQQKVWLALQTIPSGTTLTYGQLAKQLGSSPRAIGQACRRNPIPIIIPCHRVIASQHIGGYAGAIDGQLLSIKEWLLNHESNK